MKNKQVLPKYLDENIIKINLPDVYEDYMYIVNYFKNLEESFIHDKTCNHLLNTLDKDFDELIKYY
ncbi:MAG: hypothetical protein ACK5HP_00165 [Bacilli bacterium]